MKSLSHDQIISSASLTTKVFRRWLFEEEATPDGAVSQQHLLLDPLYRVLNLWRLIAKHLRDDRSSAVVLDLLETFEASGGRKLDAKATSMVLATLAQSPQAETLDIATELIKAQKDSSADLMLWNEYLHVLSKCATYNPEAALLAESIVTKTLPKYRLNPDFYTWATLLHTWTRVAFIHRRDAKETAIAAMEKAEAVLLDQIAKGEKVKLPSDRSLVVLLNAVLETWARLGNGERAEALLVQFLQQDRPYLLEQRTFGAVARAWNQSYDEDAVERIQRLFSLMEHHSCGEPTINMYNILLDACAKKPNNGPRVAAMVEELKTVSNNKADPALKPNRYTYAALLRAWGRTVDDPNASDRALSVLTKLEETDCSLLGVDLYNTLMQAWAELGDSRAPQKAMALLHQMEKFDSPLNRNTAPNTATHNVILKILVQHGLMKAARTHLASLTSANQASYAIVLRGLALNPCPQAAETARAILQQCENEELRQSPQLLILTIACHQGQHGQENASIPEEILFDLEAQDAAATDICNAVMRVWNSSREAVTPDRVHAIFEWMKEQAPDNPNLRPNFDTYREVLHAWAHSDRRSSIDHMDRVYDQLDEPVDILLLNYRDIALKKQQRRLNTERATDAMAVESLQ